MLTRCPECATVYALDGTEREETVVQTTPQVTEAPAPDPTASSFGGGSDDIVLEPAAAAATIDDSIQETSKPSAPPVESAPAPEAASEELIPQEAGGENTLQES